MIRCLIVDDEPLAQDILAGYIANIKQLELVKKCSTAIEAFEVLHQQQIDLLFLDVRMPGVNGIDFLKSLKHPPAVIFTTAFSEYAAISYELEAIDYLLKPITKERFDKSLAKLFKLQLPALSETRTYTYFKVSGKLMKINHEGILYAQSIKDYILLHTTAGRYLVYMTMITLVDTLPIEQFLRIHRSYLINKNKIEYIGKSELKIGSKIVPIGKLYRKNLGAIH